MDKANAITEILEAFKNFDGTYKKEQIDDAIELKEEITPYLVEILENVVADPDPYIQNENLKKTKTGQGIKAKKSSLMILLNTLLF